MPLKIRVTKLTLSLILISLFLISLAIHAYPLIYKGYPPHLSAESLVIAKNLHLTGNYSSTDNQGIILSSKLISSRGIFDTTENKLTALIYAKIFDIFGFNRN